ncbi:BTAD domain-containing putative transcriptional regulator [Streptomyces sp. NPDC006743]|uniref:AfsR/SARP family transcriptional regulator n=1 Tax=Streptomyces sp. NPDC006743 TaxID=3154480 RepID=UPI003455EABB
MLLLRPNTAVSVDQLTAALWEDEPPTHFKTVLQGHVSRLRALLAAHGARDYGIELTTQGTAYELQMPESLVDAHRFEELVALSRAQRLPADTVRMLREALACWQGPALTGTVRSGPLEAAAGGLEDLRLASVEALAEAYGQLGEHGRAAAVLRTEAVAHPLRESLAAALMLALGRSGRQSDAINWYHRTRRLLADELGVDPGDALTEAYATLLRSPVPARPVPAPPATSPQAPVPASAPAPDQAPAPAPPPAPAATAPSPASPPGPDTAVPGTASAASATAVPPHSTGLPATPATPAPPGPPAPPAAAASPAAATVPPGIPVPADTQVPSAVPPASAAPDVPTAHSAQPGAHTQRPASTAQPSTPSAPAGQPPALPVPGVPSAPGASGAPGVHAAPAGQPPALPAPAAPGAQATSDIHTAPTSTPAPLDPATPAAAPPSAGPAPPPSCDPTAPAAVRPGPPRAESGVPVPELLPRAPRGFTGRGAELAALDRAAGATDAPVCLITGPAGVGKTAFALHWAHQRRAGFPDGRLFADLRGFSDTPAPDTGSVLREFLLALGTPAPHVPETTAARGALFRTLTGGRRLLVVLDNARSSEQVRPLLPGGDHCVTLVTSRDRLGGLIASEAARPLPLAHLPAADAEALLVSVLGEDRVAAEPEAAARLAGLCDGLPLALRVTAARLAERPRWTLGAMAHELADEQGRLALLNVEDTGVAAALHLTVQQLPEPAARMFRALGLHTGSDLDRFTASALAGTTPAQASADLDRLAAAHLLTESVPGRWTPHDLVRLYARHLAPQADPEGLRRLLDHYLYTGLAADAAAEPGSQPCYALPADARRPAAIREFDDRAAALAWYAAERPALEGAVAAAAALGLHDRAWRLALVQWPLMLWRITDGWTPLLEAGLASAEHAEDLDAQARTRALLGWILHEEGRDAEALVHLEQAPGLAARAGDTISEAIACVNLAAVLDATGDVTRPGELMARAVALADRTGHPSTQVLTLQHLAQHCLRTGAYGAALTHTLRATSLVSPHAAVGRAQLRILCGEALAGLGRTDEAAEEFRQAAAASEAAGFTAGAERAAHLLSGLAAKR